MKRRRFYIFMAAIVVGLWSHIHAVAGTDRLLLQDVTMQNGGSAFLSLQLENEDPITGFQCDLYLPEGVTADSYMILLGRTDANHHGVTTRQMEDGAVRIVCASATSAVFSGNSGEVLSIRVGNTLGSGQYEMSLRNVILTDPDATRYVSEDVSGSITVMDSNKLELQDLAVQDVESSQTLPIYLKNSTRISGFQCDLYLPEGVEVQKNGDGGFHIDLKRTGTSEHSVVARQMEDGALRIVCSSMAGAAFSGSDGEVLAVHIRCELTDGSHMVRLKNIVLTNSDAARFTSSDASCNINIVPSFYTLTYMVDGEVYQSFSVKYRDSITPLGAPTKDGYTFSGWSEIPETMPAKDVIVTGSFTINSYTVTYVLDGEVYTTETIEYGAKIVPPVISGLEDYTIWEDVPETMPAKDITIYGKAKEIIDSIDSIHNSQFIIHNEEVYDLSGRKIDSSFFTLHSSFKRKGINIIRMSDGTIRKVLIK